MNPNMPSSGRVDVDPSRLRLIAASSSDTAKTNALLNAAKEIERLRAALANIGATP